MGKESLRGVVAKTMKTRKQVEELPEKTRHLARTGHSRKRQRLLDQQSYLQFKQGLKEWPSFLKEMRGGDGVVAKVLHLVFTFEHPCNLQFGSSRLLETCLIQ